MVEPNELIDSGLLFEGSAYGPWLEKMELVLKHKFRLDDSDLYDLDNCGLRAKVRQEVVDAICTYASSYVLSRVPDCAKKRPGLLLQSLRGQAKPFRFMKLPDHIKIMVCKILLPPEVMIYRFMNSQGVSRPFPPILHVSQQLRKTFLPVFNEKTLFGMSCSMSRAKSDEERRQIATDVAQKFHVWAYQKLQQPGLRWVRKVRLTGSLQVTFELSEKKGGSNSASQLEITYQAHTRLTAESQRLLKEHVAATEKYRKASKMKGEALILLLTSNPGLWAEMKKR